MKWRGLLSSISNNKHKHLVTRETNSDHIETLDTETLTYNNKPLNTLTSKMVYNHILIAKHGEGVHVPRISKYTNFHNIDWSIHYVNAQKIPIDTKTREFQFKFLHDLLATNFWLKKWNLAATDECTFCKNTSETIIHLFWQCTFLEHFWADFNRIYADQLNTVVDLHTIVCGSQNPLLCTLIFIAKRYVYECKYADKKPDIRIYNHKVNFIKNTEFVIAKRNGTTLRYLDKWGPLEQNAEI